MPPALVFDRVSKSFGRAVALDEVSFTVEPGEILGLVGPNGAGKTTAMQVAAGFLVPSSGVGSLLGHPFHRARSRRHLGFLPDAPVFFAGNAIEAVRFAAQLSDASPSRATIERVLDRVGIADWKRDVRRFSRGMQQRLGLAQALIHIEPSVPGMLILDEPSSALDPQGVADVRALLLELRRAGTSILLSSHQLNEVAQVSDRIALLQQGRLVREGKLDALLVVPDRVEVELHGFAPDAGFRAEWGEPQSGLSWQIDAGRVRHFLEAAWARGAQLVRVTPLRRDLTEVFLEWTRPEGEQP